MLCAGDPGAGLTPKLSGTWAIALQPSVRQPKHEGKALLAA